MIENHIVQVNHILEIEMSGSIVLEGDRLGSFKSLVKTDWEPSAIYYNKTNLMFTDFESYDKLKIFTKKCEEILLLEMKSYNLYCYIATYVNCPELLKIFEGDFEPIT